MTEDFPVSELHRNELTTDTREYAANLEDQVKAELIRLGCDSLEGYLQKADLDDVKRTREIISKLHSLRLTGEIPFDGEKFNNLYQDMLSRFDDHCIDNLPQISFDSLEAWLGDEIPKLPEIPPQIFKRDIWYLGFLLDQLKNKENARWCAGMVVGTIFNRSLEAIPDLEKRNEIYQLIDLSSWNNEINYIGYRLNGGKIVVKGNAGSNVGVFATAGTIQVEQAGRFLGILLSGATIKAGHVGTSAGAHATSGLIAIDEADDYLGYYLNGATIKANKAGSYVADHAASGEIYINEGPADISPHPASVKVFVEGEQV